MSSYYYQERQSYAASSGRPVTYAVQRLILANIIVFAVQLIVSIPLSGIGVAPPGLALLSGTPAMQPEYWLGFNPDLFRIGAIWQLGTYMFLHGGLSHLFFNMLMLYFFGPDIERILSTRQFFRFYLLCGAVGVLAQFGLTFFGSDSVPTVGASGAVLGVLAAYAVAFPQREIRIFPWPFAIYAWALALLIFLMSLFIDSQNPATAWATHAGGMVCGFVYMKSAPTIRTWFERVPKKKTKDPADHIGDAVDNIFKFDEEKRRRK
ncbi:MAG: rhomboid family intramembrane serine protease [Candidatus Hydrogenedentes bacterium]|nr:rhomboid family intramembrane serine protease [Candidatus Hydrogenedentota bacterium]